MKKRFYTTDGNNTTGQFDTLYDACKNISGRLGGMVIDRNANAKNNLIAHGAISKNVEPGFSANDQQRTQIANWAL